MKPQKNEEAFEIPRVVNAEQKKKILTFINNATNLKIK
jgi:hypothetical protein